MKARDFAKLVARRFEILKELYPEKELHITKLADNLNKDAGNISRDVSELQEGGLVKAVEEDNKEKAGGRPRKICMLTDRARRILRPIFEETKPKSRIVDVPKWQIETFLDMLNDDHLTPEFRGFIADKILELGRRNPILLIEQEPVKHLLERVTEDPLALQEANVDRYFRSILSVAIPHILANNNTKDWFYHKIHPSLLAAVSDSTKNEAVREWAMAAITKVAILSEDSSLQEKTIDRLLELYFEGGVSPETASDNNDVRAILEGDRLSNAAKSELAELGDLQETIIRKVRSHAKEPDRKEKAENLLKTLISLWMHTATPET